MKRSLFGTVIAFFSLILMLGAFPTPLQAADAQTLSSIPLATQIIWCGLISGTDFNFDTNCENAGTATQPASSTQPVVMPTYAALGDSVAAGLGLPLPANTDSSTTACGRSIEGYPNLVATDLHLTLHNSSCSGTTVGDLVTSEEVNGVEQPPQLDTAFATGVPKFISITSGANDVEWSSFIRQCEVTNCATDADTATVDALLVVLQAKLDFALGSIQERSNGTPPVTVVTGYYQPVSQACVKPGGQLTSANVAWLTAATTALNQTIQQTVAAFSFARFVPIDFTGHDICSSDPWVQSMTDPAPFHPTAKGQSVIAQDVESVFSR